MDKVHWVSTPDVGDCSDRIVMEHKGVAVLITPWNWPMNQITQKVGAALAAGCTMVLKPSELSSLSAQIFAKVMHDAKALPTLCRDRALAAARAMEAMGETRRDDPSWVDVLPIAIKDLHDVAGVRTTYGSPVYAHNLPDSSDDMVERLEAKGAIVIG
ncbi:aldehyde dehydrogenase family protein [Primorskyibacter sp. 2E107]|uniref:aldehyde dehydrogenase family protein n=1 Tax=Primorskyibacter sp. 2E107 TaxID=3403458 RepID=UPI003AF65470